MPEAQTDDITSLLQKFRSAISYKSESSRLNYAKAINSLETFLGTYSYSSTFPSEQSLADWFLNMRTRGFSAKTATHYLDIISALYRFISPADSPNTAKAAKAFSLFKIRLRQTAGLHTGCPVDDVTFRRILNATKSSSSQPAPLQHAADMLLFSLLNRAMPPGEVAKVRTNDVANDCEAISDIVARNAASNRRYLFPLSQSNLTPKQLTDTAQRRIKALILTKNLPIAGTIDNTLRLYWACIALKCGIPGSEIIALLGQPVEGIPALSLCVRAEITPQRQDALTATVNTLLADNPLRWYAMKLRSRVEFADIQRRIAELDERIIRPEFFYPYDEICLRVGKKIVKNRQPVIKDIVFFRLRVTDIFPLFCRIGDLAWCYTTTGHPGGDYAPIPKSAFDLFQETIGHFTPDYDIAPIGGFEPEEGETVVVLNGPLANYRFEVDKATDDTNFIFQLNMVGDNGFQWRTALPRRHLRPT